MLSSTKSTQRKLILVSNRLPVQLVQKAKKWEVSPASGGLVSALRGIEGHIDFEWVGWPGALVTASEKEEVSKILVEKRKCHPVFLSEDQIDRFYNGFSNRVLWPLLHYLPTHVDFSLRYWDEYKKVNELFAQKIAPLCDDNTSIWIHDYHLFLLPQLLRRRKPKARIGFFLHVPFPSSEIYRLLPVRKQILEGVLGADLVGFQTHDYLRHFTSACLRIQGVETTPNEVKIGKRRVRVDCYPIGINVDAFEKALRDRKVQRREKALEKTYRGKKIILGVDRLDYIKGLPLKFEAYHAFLKSYPELRANTVLLQVAVPSRSSVKEYQDLKDEIDKWVGRINGRFGTPKHNPISYVAQNIPFEELVALYRMSDVLLVTSIRDGMNLVCYEYSACQKGGSGVVVLSEFAGAAHSLSESISVNPWDPQAVAKGMYQALSMKRNERKLRAQKNYEHVKNFSSLAWARRFVKDLRSLEHRAQRTAVDLKQDYLSLRRDYADADQRVILLDYDGTLVPFTGRPEKSIPPKEVLGILNLLSRDSKNDLYLVSGRSRNQLNQWFGSVEKMGLAAEHGMFYRKASEPDWSTLSESVESSGSWKSLVRPILDSYVRRTPGSFVEVKTAGLVWHYRNSDEEFGEWQAHDLFVHLEEVLTNQPVEVIRGSKIIEVRSQGVNKGELVRRILKPKKRNKLVTLCIGDDMTDEDMFKALPKEAWSCRVGSSDTRARYFLKDHSEVRALLKELSGI